MTSDAAAHAGAIDVLGDERGTGADAGSPGDADDGLAATGPATRADTIGLPGGGTSSDTGPPGEVPDPVYTAVEDWVTGYFLPMFRRTLGGEFRWCAQWWQHAEAISRLTALWHAWEVLRLQPGTGIGIWYRDHLDHQLPILMGARGPFYQCSETAHREPHEAIVITAPDGWWDTDPAEPHGDGWWVDLDDGEPGWHGPAVAEADGDLLCGDRDSTRDGPADLEPGRDGAVTAQAAGDFLGGADDG